MPEGLLIGEHMEDFKLNDAYAKMFVGIREFYPDFKYHQLHSAIEAIAPDYIAAVHERREVHRILRYIGCVWCPELNLDDDIFFKFGQMYVGTSFNGATYTIEGYGDRLIGCAYFEWVREDG